MEQASEVSGKKVSFGWAKIKAFTTDGENLYLFGDGIWKYFPDDTYKKINSEYWDNTLCAAYGEGYLYTAHTSGRVYKISCDDNSKSELLNGDNWENARAMVYYRGSLIIFAVKCWQMNCGTGEYTEYLAEEWKDAKSAVVLGDLVFVAVWRLWKVDLTKESYKCLNEEDWSQTKALFGVNGRLYAAANKLWQIDQADGQYFQVHVKYSDERDEYHDLISAVAVSNGDVYGIWKSGNMWKITGL